VRSEWNWRAPSILVGLAAFGAALLLAAHGQAAVAGRHGSDDLYVTRQGATQAVLVVSARAGRNEFKAAADLAEYIERMSGARPGIAREPAEIESALAGNRPLLVVGEKAFELQPDLRQSVGAAAKQNPVWRADAILLRRNGNRVYIAGNSDLAHYFAAADLLRRWGARWYLPGEFGECVPVEPDLVVGDLDMVYASPFEVRNYWISWLGDPTGMEDFQRRNMMTARAELPPTGHSLGKYTAGLGQGKFDIPITAPETAEHVARQVEPFFAKGVNFSLGMEDGLYASDDPHDRELTRLQWDKYTLRWSITDAMLEMYNNVLAILHRKYPDSRSKVGFLAYSNMTLPPVRPVHADSALFAEIAPIDLDPIHSVDDPRSPERAEFRDMLARWAQVMGGRLTIYDYDQSMLIWRDLPNPSHMAFRQDVQHYRRAGILGVSTESRNALATTFLNLHLRAQLLWNPDADADVLLAEFYEKFYGPAAGPMRDYWQTIFAAWNDTIVTEHEYFVAPAIYTPTLVERVRFSLTEAERLVRPLEARNNALSRNERLFVERMRFTRLGFEVIDAYLAMVKAAATDGDFEAAVAAGERGLRARAELTAMSKTFTTTRIENGYAFWPGEVKQYAELLPLTNGVQGTLVMRLPIEWAFHRDAARKGLELGYASAAVNLSYWKDVDAKSDVWSRKDFPDAWEMLRTDLYAQAQGIRHRDGHSFVGDLWYRTDLDLTEAQARGLLHVMFPGVFGACRLYVDGTEIATRAQDPLWWQNDYRFEWDVDLAGKLKAGNNMLALACGSAGHFAGIFRRPFLYEAVAPQPTPIGMPSQ
jgi:hypothetical protein